MTCFQRYENPPIYSCKEESETVYCSGHTFKGMKDKLKLACGTLLINLVILIITALITVGMTALASHFSGVAIPLQQIINPLTMPGCLIYTAIIAEGIGIFGLSLLTITLKKLFYSSESVLREAHLDGLHFKFEDYTWECEQLDYQKEQSNIHENSFKIVHQKDSEAYYIFTNDQGEISCHVRTINEAKEFLRTEFQKLTPMKPLKRASSEDTL